MASPKRSVLDECEEELEYPEEVEACKMGAREAAGAGEENIDIMRSEGDLHEDVHENVREISSAFSRIHSSSAHFANNVNPKLDDLEEDLADRLGTERWAVSNEISDAYYYGANEQIEEEVQDELGGRLRA